MKKKDLSFWTLSLIFIFGVAVRWPLWSKLITIVLSGMILVQASTQFFQAYSKER